ncbi:hypothetical protein Cgig2_022862 [Carnegiea gigantea]|uniref:CCHC-type domain-containing protein n=1 Tax=Carnegiea gigantea TaxID=171969 RepID=A0A9Q1QLH9_9CARY|nr:hypothetical protein Cgig2_022862 [Carnegiea gigantea]
MVNVRVIGKVVDPYRGVVVGGAPSEDMGLEEVRRKVSEITGNELTVQKLWYSLKAAMKGCGGCSDDHPQTRVRVGGEIIEMSDDDEISIASEDVEEDEAAVQGGEESSQAKANLWVSNYVHPIYKSATQQIIYNQLVHPMETHNMGIVDAKTGQVVGGDELDDDYNCCILAPTNRRQSGRPPSKHRESQTQGTRCRRCSKCGEVGHTRRTCRNPRANFDANYEGDIVEVEALLDGSYVPGNLKCLPGRKPMFTVVKHGLQPGAGRFTLVCVLMIKCRFALVGAVRMRPVFIVVNHGVQVVHLWETGRLKLCYFGFLIIQSSQL